jgi:hypothetical protein
MTPTAAFAASGSREIIGGGALSNLFMYRWHGITASYGNYMRSGTVSPGMSRARTSILATSVLGLYTESGNNYQSGHIQIGSAWRF